MGFEDSLKIDKGILEKAKFNPYFMEVQSALGKTVKINHKNLISLGSNDYLGIANSKELKESAKKAIDKYGISMCGTPIVIGYTDLNKILESKIAKFLGFDDSLVFPSGYQANLGAFKFLAGKEDVIIVDEIAHSSVIQGARLCRAKLIKFAHNNTDELEQILKFCKKYRKRFIAVDGLYSTEGDIASLDIISELAKKYDAFTIVDDAHGIGILGKNGKGSLELKNVLGKIDMVTGSLGKALGCAGGFIATNSKVAEFFRYFCPPFVYSTALPPSIVAASIASLDLVEKSEAKRKRLYKNKEMLFNGLKEIGYNLTESDTPLFSIKSKEAQEIINLARDLYKKGVYATPFVPPSVPLGSSRLRLIPHAGLGDEEINTVIRIFKDLKSR
ncbi:MAG: aminotransferase class I/II-fold pyridoxal phosphate-dependent enzyme [Nanoarchaeota archaeon]|nr:aminotransferase class I/II-fold pyridoxal phosphate-dependent enzyme [Nanoarchaeota archaeon]